MYFMASSLVDGRVRDERDAAGSTPSSNPVRAYGDRRAVRTLNLGILAHVDAGKTTLTERLLYGAGSSTSGFRALTAIVLRRALERAGTAVWEPVHAFSLEIL